MEARTYFHSKAALAAWAVLLTTTIMTGAIFAQIPTEENLLESRQALAESGLYSLPFIPTDGSSANALADAMDIDPSLITSISLSASSGATGVFNQLGVLTPRRGGSFSLMSSGVAGTNAPEPGTSFGQSGALGFDEVILEVTLDLPVGVNRITFDFNFLSSEYPDFIGSVFNDTFQVNLQDASGSRTIAFASVNSSFFFPASNQRAGGSGFDIFTPNPAGVNTSFGTGLPDAGLTDFQTVSAEVDASGPVTLIFSIMDLGDHILDSAVIIDNVAFSSFEIIDPNPDFISSSGIFNDSELLAVGGKSVIGAAADGVTQVLLRAAATGPGSVAFTMLSAQSPEDGALTLVGQSGGSDTVTAPTVLTSQGYRAYAVYHSPVNFDRGGDGSLNERSFDIEAVFTPDSGPTTSSSLPFKLVRPPIVLIHGLWSAPGTWTLPLVNDARFQTETANYQATNASHFSTNLNVPFTAIRSSLRTMRDQSIAATQADLVGHSMGGILARNWFSSPNYLRDQNFHQGDIHKLITLNTPHTGSPLANLLATLRETFLIGPLISTLMAAADMPIDEGAIDDLSNGSSAINAITQTNVPGHAMVGIGGSGALALAPGTIGQAYTIINFLADSSDLFEGLQHDFIVGRNSQEGGMPASAYTVFNGLDSIHIRCTGSNNYSNRLVTLLNAQVTGTEFDTFPAPSTLAIQKEAPITPFFGGSVSEGLSISTPAPGTVVQTGDTVQITVTPLPGVVVDQVLLSAQGVAEVDVEAPFVFSITIPSEALGSFEIEVLGSDSSGNYFTAPASNLQVLTSANLQSMTIFPSNPILFGVGAQRQIQVLGSFDDGQVRDLSSDSTGTVFLIDNPSILGIDANGLVTAVGEGTTTLVAINSNMQDSITVTVLPACELSTAFLNRLPMWPSDETILTLMPFVGCN